MTARGLKVQPSAPRPRIASLPPVGGILEYSGWFQLVWEILFAVLLAVVGVYTRQIASLKRANARRAAENAALREQAADQNAEMRAHLAALEARCLKSEDLTNVHRRVDGLTKEVHSMIGKLDSLDAGVARIHDYLLNKGGGK